VLQCVVAVCCCNVLLQCVVAVCCRTPLRYSAQTRSEQVHVRMHAFQSVAVCCSVLQCATVCYSVFLQRVGAGCCRFPLEGRAGMMLQGGEDPWDAISCRSFFAKEPLIIGLFFGK